MPGLSYLEETLLSFGGVILYSIMLFITICARIMIYERNQKSRERKYTARVIIIIFIIIGIVFLLSKVIFLS